MESPRYRTLKTLLVSALIIATGTGEFSFSSNILLQPALSKDSLAVLSGFDAQVDTGITEKAALRYTVLKIADIIGRYGMALDTPGLRDVLKAHVGHLSEAAIYLEGAYRDGDRYCLNFQSKDGTQKVLKMAFDEKLQISVEPWSDSPYGVETEKFSSRLRKVRKSMPVYEILRMMDMPDAEILRRKETGIEMLSLYEVALPPPRDPRNRPWSDDDVFNLREGTYDVLMGPRGVPIAVFHNQTGKYLDLTDFGFSIPEVSSDKSAAEWKDFSARSALEKHLLEYYIDTSLERDRYVSYGATGPPYCYIEADSSGSIKKIPFYPYTYDPARWKADLSRPHAVLPQFPTVYPATRNSFSDPDESYYQKILKPGEFDIGRKDSVLILGPGTGVDTWMASLFTDKPLHVIGINPFEIANVRATARAAGFKVEAMVHNNIADREGEKAFPGKFDKVLWNMPCISQTSFSDIEGYWTIWDGDIEGEAARHFIKHLPASLKDEGEVLLWNAGGGEREKFVVSLLEEQGLIVKTERVKDPAGKFRMNYSVYLARRDTGRPEAGSPATYFPDGILVGLEGERKEDPGRQALIDVLEMSELTDETAKEAVSSILEWYSEGDVVHDALLYNLMEEINYAMAGKERRYRYAFERVYIAMSRPEISGEKETRVEGIITVQDLGDGNPLVSCIELRPGNRKSQARVVKENATGLRGVGRQLIFHAVNRELERLGQGKTLRFSVPGARTALEKEGLINEKSYRKKDLKSYLSFRDSKNLSAAKRSARNSIEKPSAAPEETAQAFVNTVIRAVDSREKGERVIVALDTSWIPEEQRAIVQSILNGLSAVFGLSGMESISIVRGEGEKIIDEIEFLRRKAEKENEPVKGENIILIGDRKVFSSKKKEFLPYKNAGAFFGEIVIPDPALGTTDLRILEKIYQSIEAAIIKGEKYRQFMVVPDAEMMPVEELGDIYSRSVRFIRSL